MKERILKKTVLNIFRKQTEIFNGKNFCLEVNFETDKNLEFDTIKRRMRQLRSDRIIDYKYIGNFLYRKI